MGYVEVNVISLSFHSRGGTALEKKEWADPELIVLVRSKPEELVLSGCKGVSELVNSAVTFVNCSEAEPCVGCLEVGLT
jgi:hypothetical protein